MSNLSAAKTPRNPTITAVFPTKNESGNFISPPLNSEAFTVIQKNVAIGNRLFLKKSTKQDKNGNEYFFLEILPPMDGEAPTANRNSGKKKSTTDDSI